VIARLAEHQPDDVAVQAHLASTLQHLERHAEAAAIYEPLLAHAPQFPLLLNNYAAALMNTGRQDEALPIFRQEVAAHPDNTLARVNLAAMLRTALTSTVRKSAAHRLRASCPTTPSPATTSACC
jgi:predicted Zn-dependent protease